jgi:hypothetical protein
MSGAASLSGAAINLAALREQTVSDLAGILDEVRGKKGLVLDPSLSGPLSLVAKTTFMKEHEVEKIYILGPRLETASKYIIYLVRPTIEAMQMIAAQILQHADRGQVKDYMVCFVPRRTMICEQVLEDKGVYADVTVRELHMDLVALDTDVLSLDLNSCFYDAWHDDDSTSLFYTARALMKMQVMFGFFPNVRAFGKHAKVVGDMILRMRSEMGDDDSIVGVAAEMDSVLIIDRSVDLISAVATQKTYEGLMSEIFTINNSHADLDSEIVAVGEDRQKKLPPKVKYPLNSDDDTFRDLRDLPIHLVGRSLQLKARECAEFIRLKDELHSIIEIKNYVKKLPSIQAMQKSTDIHANIVRRMGQTTRTALFEDTTDVELSFLHDQGAPMDVDAYIDGLIARNTPVHIPLRLLCLQSICGGGLKARRLNEVKRDLIHQYGFHLMHGLNSLAGLGLLKVYDRSSFALSSSVRKATRCCTQQNEEEPTDTHFTYSRFAPLSIRAVQGLLATLPGAERPQDAEMLRALPGGPPLVQSQARSTAVAAGGDSVAKNISCVVFVGGCTHAEISALRFLASKDASREFIIITTKVFDTKGFLGTILESGIPAVIDSDE